MVKRPSDLGFSDEGYKLPPLHTNKHTVHNTKQWTINGQSSLFAMPAKTMTEVREEQKLTVEERCEKAVELAIGKTSVYWCNLNEESALLADLDADAVEIRGGMSIDKKEEILVSFAKGEINRLITKAKKGDLHNRRLIVSKLQTLEAAHKLVDDIAELMTRFNIQRVIPDECAAGSFMIEDMIQKGWNITPMSFKTWKVKKYGAFRRHLDTGKVLSYPDEELKKEMFAMEYSQGKQQSYIEHAPGYSDDLIDGFVMSAFHYLQTEYGGNTYDIDDYDSDGGSLW
jgi:hypothetical protein